MTKYLKHFVARLLFVQFIILIIIPVAFPQTMKGFFKTKLKSEEVEELIGILKSEKHITKIQERFFNLANADNKLYDPNLTNLVFFIDKTKRTQKGNHQINITLIKGKKRKKVLFGARYVYVQVFVADNKLNPENLSAKCSSLDWRRPSGEFFLFSIVKGLVGFLGEASIKKETANSEDDDKDAHKLNMSNLGSYGHIGLSYGRAKIPLNENTINRITISGFDGFHPQATFGNYSSSRLTSSVGLMYTRPKDNDSENDTPDPDPTSTDTSIDTSGEKIVNNNEEKHDFEPFFFLHYYIKRPELPKRHYNNNKFHRDIWHKLSCSILVGTKIEAPIFEDVFVGLCFGNFLIESLGLVIGANFRSIKSLEDDKVERKKHFAVGLTYIF